MTPPFDPQDDVPLREAAYWFREMLRAGGPDGSDLDEAVSQDFDQALGDWQPTPMLPFSTLLTYEERRDVSSRIPWRQPDPDPLTVPYPGWSRDDLSAPDPEWQPKGRGSDPRMVVAWVAVGILFVAVLAALVVVTR